jgi:hypothetical protein
LDKFIEEGEVSLKKRYDKMEEEWKKDNLAESFLMQLKSKNKYK